MAERDVSIDALKGIAMMAVVLGHVIVAVASHSTPSPGTIYVYGAHVELSALYDPVYNVIQSVNMPLFAFVSGLLLGLRPTSDGADLLRKRAWSLMLPWLAWVVLGRIQSVVAPATFAKSIGAALLNPEASGLWFLYALFECYVVYALVRAVSKRDWILILVAVAFAATNLLPLSNVLGMRYLSFILPFFLMGVLAATRSWWRRPWAVFASGAAFAASLALTWPTTFATDQWWATSVRASLNGVGLADKFTNVWLLSAVYQSSRYVCGATGIVLLYALYSRSARWFVTPQAWVGRRSLGIYVMHAGLIAPVVAAGVTGVAPVFVAVSAVAVAATLVLERIPGVRNVLLGQRPTSMDAARTTHTQGHSAT